MTYIPENQHRCIIIRGKTQSEMEDLLPVYANMVSTLCPCTSDEFVTRGYSFLSKALYGNGSYDELDDNKQKTVRNHFTEIAGKLLALYYKTPDGYVIETEACKLLRERNDFPLFFKSLCLNFQFPNGTNKPGEVKNRVALGINLKPYCYVVSLLYLAQQKKILLTKQEIGYYVLNNLDVLRGEVPESVVLERILEDRKNKIHRPKLRGSHDWQHIKEQFNMLELSYVAVADRTHIWLNKDEASAIALFLKNRKVSFDVNAYNLNTSDGRKTFESDWGKYYGAVNKELLMFQTDFSGAELFIADRNSLSAEKGAVGLSTVDLGDKGEALVYRLECERVRNYKERLVNKVLLLGKTKGLGYDISSIEADENPSRPEFARYIEVKSTIRVTEPSFDELWTDSLNLTSKEWVAAEQYGSYYNIYRVYFTMKKTIVVRIQNPYKRFEDKEIEVFPTIFQMNFGKKVVEKRYVGEEV